MQVVSQKTPNKDSNQINSNMSQSNISPSRINLSQNSVITLQNERNNNFDGTPKKEVQYQNPVSNQSNLGQPSFFSPKNGISLNGLPARHQKNNYSIQQPQSFPNKQPKNFSSPDNSSPKNGTISENTFSQAINQTQNVVTPLFSQSNLSPLPSNLSPLQSNLSPTPTKNLPQNATSNDSSIISTVKASTSPSMQKVFIINF